MKDRPQTLDMLKVLRTGKPANWGSYDPQAWAQAMEREDFADAVHRGDGLPRRAARAGAGEESSISPRARRCSISRAAPGSTPARSRRSIRTCAPPSLRSRPSIASPAKPSRSQDAAERVSVIAGDMFKDAWPAGFDVHLISNVLHDWEEPVVRDLLAQVARRASIRRPAASSTMPSSTPRKPARCTSRNTPRC